MTLESLARTIAKARHGTDAMWANYMGAAEAVQREAVEACASLMLGTVKKEYGDHRDYIKAIRSLIAQPSGAQ